MLHLGDGVTTRLRAKCPLGKIVTVAFAFADFRSVTRSVTLDMPISATASLVEIAHDLLRTVLTDYPAERSTSVGDLRVAPGEHWDVQLGLPAWA